MVMQFMGAEAPAPKVAPITAATIASGWADVGSKIQADMNATLANLMSMVYTGRESKAALEASRADTDEAPAKAGFVMPNVPMIAMIGVPAAIVGLALLARRPRK